MICPKLITYRKFDALFLILLYIICNGNPIQGQQLAQKGLYMLDPYSFNPAFGGLNNGLTVTGDFRKQWSDIEGRPVSEFVSAHMPLLNLNSGVGVNLIHEGIGASKIIEGSFSYNYILPQTGPLFLSIGGGLGMISRQLDGNILRTPDGNYETSINHNDPNIPTTKISDNNGVINLGLAMRIGLLEMGISSYQTVAFRISNKDNYHYSPAHHFTLYTSYFYTFNENWKIVPNALIKYDMASLQTELDIHLYNKNIFGGVGIRGYNSKSIDAIKIIIGGRITEKIMVAYNYESALSGIKTYSGNSHELLLQYRIPANLIERQKEKLIYHPRM
ncbi:MAG: PorP/SprF family type IX secretion system membrane protein [Saprospiraceae bacterium]